MGADVLPSSLCTVARNVKRSPWGNSVPVFCMNCGKEWGRVIPKMITFACCLCNDCADKHGDPAGLMKEPDHVFWERHRQAVEDMQRVSALDMTTPDGLARALDDASSPLAKVAREWQAAVGRAA